jgi:hypothetical protein
MCCSVFSLGEGKKQYNVNADVQVEPLWLCRVGRNALHVDVHMPSGFLYWCDFSSTVTSQNGIRRIKPDGAGFRSVVTSGIGRNGIRGIAVDWAAGRASALDFVFRELNWKVFK